MVKNLQVVDHPHRKASFLRAFDVVNDEGLDGASAAFDVEAEAI